MWKFDVLSIPKLREIAVRDAVLADIILISSHGDPLPDHVLKWAESWSMEGSQALALVALFDRPESQNGSLKSVREYLADLAKRGQMEFFAQPNFWPGAAQRNSPFYVASNSVPSDRTFSPLTGAGYRDAVPRWGINSSGSPLNRAFSARLTLLAMMQGIAPTPLPFFSHPEGIFENSPMFQFQHWVGHLKPLVSPAGTAE